MAIRQFTEFPTRSLVCFTSDRSCYRLLICFIAEIERPSGHTAAGSCPSGEALNSYLRVDRISQGDDDASVKSEPDITQPLLPPEMLLAQPIKSPMLQRVKEVCHHALIIARYNHQFLLSVSPSRLTIRPLLSK